MDEHQRFGGGGRPPPLPPRRPSQGLPWPLILVLVLLVLLLWPLGQEQRPAIPYTRFKRELTAGNIERLEAQGESLSGTFKQAIVWPETDEGEDAEPPQTETFQTTLPPFGDEQLTEQILAQDVTFVSKGSGASMLKLILINSLPLLLIFGLIIWMSRRAARQAGGLLSISRSRARKFEKERTSVTFEDVAGVEEAKEGLKEIISFLREPHRFRKLGCRVPKGVLLVGAPGTGKTLLARATAGEAGVPFYSITGSDFVEMFVGVGASRVRDLFGVAKRNTPCIIFLDELDSVGRHRGAGLGGGHDEREQTLNQLLSEIDGFEPTDNLVVLAATNRPDVLDPALLRPGRFDRRVTVDLPALKERVEILRVHARKVPMDEEVDLATIAASMPGRSGADLSNLINESALLAAKRGKDKVGRQEVADARDRILMGQLRGGIVLSDREKKAVAVHEAGHALMAHLTPESDRLEKVSIIPRGRALGVTQQLPEERYNYTEQYMIGRLKVMLGGRVGEQVVLGTISTGAADDLGQATRLARHMVSQWGMGDTFRNVAFDVDGDHEVFLGEQLGRRREYSEETARDIDMEIKNLIDRCYTEAEATLEANKERLETVAAALERDETLEGDTLKALLETEPEREESS